MCRSNQLCGVALIAFGLGLLMAGFFESIFFCGCISIGMILGGIVVVQKK